MKNWCCFTYIAIYDFFKQGASVKYKYFKIYYTFFIEYLSNLVPISVKDMLTNVKKMNK